MVRFGVAWFVLVWTLAAGAQGPVTVLHCGQLLAEPGEPPMGESSIIIRDGVIEAVTPGIVFIDGAADAPPNVHIDLRDRFVMPGLIDCHTHLTFEMPPMSIRLRRTLTETTAHRAIDSTVFAERTLLAGFTTARNVGSIGEDIYALRDRINQGMIVGPRILAAGKSIAVTGGISPAPASPSPPPAGTPTRRTACSRTCVPRWARWMASPTAWRRCARPSASASNAAAT